MPKRAVSRPWSRLRFNYPRRRELPLWLNVSRAAALGLVYGFIELQFVSTSAEGPYRVAYFLLLSLPFINLNLFVWGADAVFATTVQDASFWVMDYASKGALPSAWAWFYPVWGHLPLLYIPAVPLIVYLYRQGARHRIE
jgi:hypothetical protein